MTAARYSDSDGGSNSSKLPVSSAILSPIWMTGGRAVVVVVVIGCQARSLTPSMGSPPGVVTVRVHSSGRRAGPCDPPEQTQEEYFRIGTEPPVDPLLPVKCGPVEEAETAASGTEQSVEEEELEL